MSERFIPLNFTEIFKNANQNEYEDARSPLSCIIPQENRGSSRRDIKMKFT